MANTPAPAPAAAAPKAAAPTGPTKRKYVVIAGKTFVRDAQGEEVRYDIGEYVMLTDAEAAGRTNQVQLFVPAQDAKAKNEDKDE